MPQQIKSYQLPWTSVSVDADVLYWGVLGAVSFLWPDSALGWNYKLAKRYGWSSLPIKTFHVPGVGEQTSPVSDTLRM